MRPLAKRTEIVLSDAKLADGALPPNAGHDTMHDQQARLIQNRFRILKV